MFQGYVEKFLDLLDISWLKSHLPTVYYKFHLERIHQHFGTGTLGKPIALHEFV